MLAVIEKHSELDPYGEPRDDFDLKSIYWNFGYYAINNKEFPNFTKILKLILSVTIIILGLYCSLLLCFTYHTTTIRRNDQIESHDSQAGGKCPTISHSDTSRHGWGGITNKAMSRNN